MDLCVGADHSGTQSISGSVLILDTGSCADDVGSISQASSALHAAVFLSFPGRNHRGLRVFEPSNDRVTTASRGPLIGGK